MKILDHPTITSTQLRTHTTQLVKALKKGKIIHLIHRSEIVGIIYPTSKIFASKSLVEKKSQDK